MCNLVWHDYLVFLSFIACIAGLILLFKTFNNPSDDVEAADRMLFMMTFTYWLVYCLAFGAQKLVLPDWETAMLSLKFTTVISYLLTFSCVLGLPLHRYAASRRIQE
jgi:hypothetical protein